MRLILPLVLLAALVVPALVPHAAAAPSCQTLERIVPTAAGTTTARVESCFDVIAGTGYTYRTWTNTTSVRTVSDATGYTSEILLRNFHGLYEVGTQTYEERYHVYRASAYDWDSPALRSAYVTADNYQGKSGGQCSEGTGAGASQYGPSGATNVGQAVYGGDDSAYVLPCTTEDAQNTLP